MRAFGLILSLVFGVMIVCPSAWAANKQTYVVVVSGEDQASTPGLTLVVDGVAVKSAAVTAKHTSNQWQTITFNVTPSKAPQNFVTAHPLDGKILV
jgi:hypothetical protein